MTLEGTLGKYTVWAIRNGKKEVSQNCAALDEALALKAEWELIGYAVKIVEGDRRAYDDSRLATLAHDPNRR